MTFFESTKSQIPNPKSQIPKFKNSKFVVVFLSSPLKSVTNNGVAWMGLNFQPNIRGAIEL